VIVATVSPSVVFAFLVNASGALIVFIYIAIAFSHIRLRNARPNNTVPQLAMWFFPWLSYLTIAAMIVVLIAMAFTPSLASQLWISVLAVAVVLSAYMLRRYSKATAG
jgi:GABA permease